MPECHPAPRWSARLGLLAALLITTHLNAQSLNQSEDEVLHSDLPLYGRFGSANVWPQHFDNSEGDFGCASRVDFGDWVLRKRGPEDQEDELWYRISNYGAIHCWAITRRAFERSSLDSADSHASFFVLLGTTRVDGKDVELWALQLGAMPGSNYVLLSRVPAEEIIQTFTVLQIACPKANVRDAGLLSILLTRYCLIGSREELIKLARRMAQRPPLGTFTRVPDADETKEAAPEKKDATDE